MPRPAPAELVERATQGDRAALARLLSVVEQGGARAREAGSLIYPLGGQAHTVGMTGSPGAGKSTLTGALVSVVRATPSEFGAAGTMTEVAVLAIDPSSPFTGGAILGDRVRMQDHALDTGVFIRSMATRGQLGGLSLATPAAVRVLDAVGFGWVFIETVGVGQVEVEVAGAADTTVVVVNPGWGDAVQANKAGLMEIADLFVINKADRPGVADSRRDLEQMLELSNLATAAWHPPILATVASTGQGVEELWAAIGTHRHHLETSGELERRRQARLDDELRRIVVERLNEMAQSIWHGPELDELRDELEARTLDPYSAAERLLARFG